MVAECNQRRRQACGALVTPYSIAVSISVFGCWWLRDGRVRESALAQPPGVMFLIEDLKYAISHLEEKSFGNFST